LTERLAWAAAWSAAQFPPADKPRINMRKQLLQPSGSSPEVQLPDSGPWRGPSAVTSPESRASFLSRSIRNTESGVKESSSAEVATEAPVEWESPLRGDPSVIPIPAEQVPEEPDIGLSANRFFTRRTQLLAGTMAVFSVIGLSLVSRSVPSTESSKPEASRETSGFQAPSQDRMRSLDQDYLMASTAPASLNQPSEPSSTIQGSPTIHPERKSGNSMFSTSSIPELMISDISPVERQPFLKTMVRPGLSATEIRRMGSNSFVVILELNQDGKVKKAILLTPDPERIFPDQILDTVRKWQFAPRDRHQRGAWVKYFSFQAPSGAHP